VSHGHDNRHSSKTTLLRWLRLRNWPKAALKQYGLRGAHYTLLKETPDQRKLVVRVEAPSRGCFLLRMYKLSRPSENLLPEMLWLQALRREMSLSVPEPIPSTKGSLVSYASPVWALEPRRCVLLGWLPGKREKADINPTNLSLAGSYVARLHQHSEQYGIREGLVFPHVWDWDWIFGEAAPLWKKGQSVYSRGDLDVFCATAERVWQDLQELGKGNNVFGIIHRDLHLNNFVFHDGKAYAIDFEVCGWGYYLFDLAVTLSSLEGQGRYRAPMQTAFIEGYQRERPLPEGEWRYLDTFIAMRIVQRVNIILHWEAPTWRRWGPNFLIRSVKGLKEFVSNKERAGQIDFGSPWWHTPFQK
jgi:Ser/Thr protein kinase RdoA (MazF antagonist)